MVDEGGHENPEVAAIQEYEWIAGAIQSDVILVPVRSQTDPDANYCKRLCPSPTG